MSTKSTQSQPSWLYFSAFVLSIVLMFSTMGLLSCTNCAFVACSGAFDLRIEHENGVLSLGEYELLIQTERNFVHYRCSVEDVDQSECVVLDEDFEETKNSFEIIFHHHAKLGIFDLGIVRFYDNEKRGQSIEGPKYVEVRVVDPMKTVTHAIFEPEYERFEYAGEGCGWCEETDPLSMTLPTEGGMD